MKIILASGSPRRIEMLQRNGFDPYIIPSDYDEHIPLRLTPAETVMFLSLQKGLDVSRKISGYDKCLIVSADTIVLRDKKILGKPRDENEAYEMLSSLSGRRHNVLTGVCLISFEGVPHSERLGILRSKCFFESSEVSFKEIPEEELRSYIKTGEPYDKAGGYAIQGSFRRYTDHITGDLDNIIGFPLSRFLKELETFS